MKVIVTGATGFIGRHLVKALLQRGDQVTALTRGADRAGKLLGPGVQALEWSPPQPGPWMDTFGWADAVINLAGEPVAAKRWTAKQKDRILHSRVDATTAVVDAIAQAEPRPSVLISGSASGYYGSRGDTVLTEETTPGSDFLADVVKQWEAAALKAEALGVRVVLVRTGIVLGRGGGALSQLTIPFRLFVGGTMGYPAQWIPWVHIEDEVGIILYALDHAEIRGPIIAASPNPVTMTDLSRQIGRALHRPSWVPMLGPAMKIALGGRAEAVLASQRMLPIAAEAAGYRFTHTQVDEALQSVL
jgi:uncharacterized protein (TIGR01777 family)